MPKWNAKEVKKLAKQDFENAWKETKKLIEVKADREKIKAGLQGEGKAHALFETIAKLRKAYLELGFEEIANPVFIEDKEIHKQFGNEAVAVLDRCYYLAGLPRPEIGLSDEKIESIKKYAAVSGENIALLKDTLRKYKLGEIAGDDLVYEISKALRTSGEVASRVIENVFPEMKKLKPEASNITLRSHMTSGWFLTLQETIKKRSLPLRLFSIDRCFRREQKEDESHLRTYFSASSVIASEDASVELGEELSKALLSKFGFSDFKFRLDEKRSKYYAPDTQTEVYGKHPNLGWLEIATFGIYSPVALSSYDIEYPVMNLGLGVERLAMILHSVKDARELAYAYFKEVEMSNEELAKCITIEKAPQAEEGKEIAKKIVEAGIAHGNTQAPCEFLVYEGNVLGKKVKVKLVEVEENTKLLGPAMLNRIYVKKGSIYGMPEKKEEGLTDTGITYLSAFASLAAHEIENAVKEGKKEAVVRVKGIKLPSDINLKISEEAVNFITSKNKKIDIRGPGFTTVQAEIS